MLACTNMTAQIDVNKLKGILHFSYQVQLRQVLFLHCCDPLFEMQEGLESSEIRLP